MATHPRITSVLLNAIVIVLFFLGVAAKGEQLSNDKIKKLDECSLSKTNKDCKLMIDRNNPVAPSTVQMYSGQTVTVIVKNPKFYERYFLDFQTGQATVSPDVTSSVIQGLLAPMAKFVAVNTTINKMGIESLGLKEGEKAEPKDNCAVLQMTDPNWPEAKKVADAISIFKECLAQLATTAIVIYKALEPFVAPDSLTPKRDPNDGKPETIHNKIEDLKDIRDKKDKNIENFLKSESKMSTKITAISGDPKFKDKPAENGKPAEKADPADLDAITQLGAIQKLADAVATDLAGYRQRIIDLGDGYMTGVVPCSDVVKDEKKSNGANCVSITSNKDDKTVYQNMVTRTITYSLNALNLVSNSQEAAVPDPSKRKALASVAINFADESGNPLSAFRWEASVGTFFSSLPNRSFTAAPHYPGAIPAGPDDNTVAQTILRPSVVPFAAVNYRLSNDLGWTRWKSNFYWTGAVGINTNTTSADFATGLSLSWRALLLSVLCHFGHDVRLTQGLHVGDSLGSGFKGSVPSQPYWTESLAFGVSVRIPSLTGR